MSTLVKTKFTRPLMVQEELLKKRVFFVTPLEFSRIFAYSLTKTKYFLESYTRKGLFVRLKKGLYVLKSNWPSEEEISNALYKPSYISFEYALAKHNVIPEMVYEVTAATTKPTRVFQVDKKIFTYYKIKQQAFVGYSPVKLGGRVILLAEPEKALVDYLYFVSLGKKSLNGRLNLKALDRKKIQRYAKLYQRPGLIKLIEKL